MLDAGTEEPQCWWVSFESIAENEFNLAGSRYRPRVGQEASDDDAGQLIREIVVLEREIQDGLEKILADVETTA